MKNVFIASIGIVASNETLVFDQPDENSFDNFVTVAPFHFETAEPWGTAALNRNLNNKVSEDIYQLCPSLPVYEDWLCKLDVCRYKCKGGKTEKATCIFTNGKYKWTGSANPFCLVEENLPQEEKYQPSMPRSRPSPFESCPEVFGQNDYWVCDGKRCEMTCHGPNLGDPANVNPEEIVVPGKPRVYDGKQGDVTFQIQCHCRNKNCAFAGYTLPPCMAARKTTSAIRGRSMNRNPIDLFKYVPVKREKQEIKTKSESTEISVVDDLSEYLIENRFATDAQKTNIWSKLKGSKPADWKFCQGQINDSEWYCSGTTCKSICQREKSAPLLPLKGIKPIQGVSIIRCYCTGLECSFGNIQKTQMPSCEKEPDYQEIEEEAPLGQMMNDFAVGGSEELEAVEEVEEESEEVREEVKESEEKPRKQKSERKPRKLKRKQEDDMDLAWDVNIPPLENSKPKRYIRCEKSLGASQKWWMCDSQFCKTKCSKNKPIRCYCNDERCRFSGIVRPTCLMKRMERLGLVDQSESSKANDSNAVDMTQRSFEGAKPERDIGDSVVRKTKEKNILEIRNSQWKPSKILNDDVRVDQDGKMANVRDIFRRFKDYLAKLGVKFV